MRWPWRKRWRAVIVGEWSGNVTELTFVEFRHERDAFAWVDRMNAGKEGGGTHYEARPLP